MKAVWLHKVYATYVFVYFLGPTYVRLFFHVSFLFGGLIGRGAPNPAPLDLPLRKVKALSSPNPRPLTCDLDLP